MAALLNIIAEQFSFGANMWARVGTYFNNWATANMRSNREIPSLKSKFYRMASKKKPTEDFLCPSDVHRKKKIARNILENVQAAVLNCESSSDSSNEGPVSTPGSAVATSEYSFLTSENQPRISSNARNERLERPVSHNALSKINNSKMFYPV